MERKFNILLDPLPKKAVVNGREYVVKTDFRQVLSYLRLIDGQEDDEVKRVFSFRLFFDGKIEIEDAKELTEWLGWYLSKGEEKPDEPKRAPVFDLIADSNRIYAAFFQVYGINLRKARMHWWAFSYLLEGLPSGTHLSDVVEIRGRRIDKDLTPAQKNDLQRLKDRYRIGEKQDVMAGVFDSLVRIC